MKILWKGTEYGQFGFHTELEEYDGTPPVASLLMDARPRISNPEREAIAAYLAFGHWVSGDLQLPHKLGPNTAAAIENDLKHISVRPSPIEYYPKPLEIGTRDVTLSFNLEVLSASAPSVSVLKTSEWNGSMRSLNSLAVASNAFALDEAASTNSLSIRARLAVAVLFAADFSVDRFVLEPETSALLTDDEKQRLTALLLASRLGLA